MSLTPEQQAEIERLVAERVAQLRGRDRMRVLVWVGIVGLVLAVVIGGGIALGIREMRSLQARMERQASDLEVARMEYQRQLANDRKMQAEREAAAKAVGYKPGQSSAAYNAGMLRDFVSFMSKSGELRERMQKIDTSDPANLERFADDLEKVLHEGLGTIGQVVLRNTEPTKAAAEPAAPAAPPPPPAPTPPAAPAR